MKRYLFLLILLTSIVYLNSLSAGFVWDDLNNIVNNPQLKGPMKLGEVFLKLTPKPSAQFYRPIPYLTIAFDYFLWKDNPFGYHLTNFLFHLFNVLLIFSIVKLITNSDFTSFLCTILFALHPVHTEAVAYISGRSDSACAIFLFASLYFYIRSLKVITNKRFIYLSLSVCLSLMGLFSKEIALIFPLLILAYNACFLERSLRFKRSIPFIALAAGFLLFRYFFTMHQPMELNFNTFHLWPKIFLFYVRLLIFPFGLHMQHSLEENDFLLKAPFFLWVIIFTGFIFTIFKYRRKKEMVFGLSWFLIALLPFLGIFQLNSDIAEHWLYFASFGFFLLVSQVRFLNKKFVLSIIILLFGILTIQRNFIWQDDISIYKDTLKFRADDPKLHYNLGNAYFRKGLFKEAYKEYKTALSLKSDYDYTLHNLRFLETAYAYAEEQDYFDHTLYGEVLTKFVKDGKVDYVSLKKGRHTLDEYLKQITDFAPRVLESMPQDEKIAFYINAYNAFTLKIIVDYYPVKSIKDILGVWDKIKFKATGRELTLNQIEHEILRKEFQEPRIHFALVCASKGCPKLAEEPFSGEDLDEQLEREAHKFINDKTKVRLDRNNVALYLSSIFKWFNEDFGDVIKFISKYLPEDNVEFIEKTKPKIQYLNYDWSLNER